DRRFRQALSYAINRKRINDISYFGLGRERNALVIPASPFYVPGAEAEVAQFDPDRASALLDEAGLRKGPDGFRRMASGRVLELTIETVQTSGAIFDSIELVRKDWENVGLKTAIKSSLRESFWPRALGNEIGIAVWPTDRGIEPFVDPIYLVPF